jgi:eukaryotic-like serine/threonine-protein kinase
MAAAPHKIGRYEIIRPLGRSMNDVYLAIDTVENRQAALKLIKPDGDQVTLLVVEAERRGAALQRELHGLDPRMVEVYDFGDADGYFFVAMQYIEGRNLAEVLEAESAIDPTRAAVIALEICEQLAKFHSRQWAVVHGDIKPSNIHLSPNDTVRLLDFGIAKRLRAAGGATVHSFGSPSYCAPERLARSAVDEQSDLWAVGATLYEMLAGVPPYRAADTRRLENIIRSKHPPRALPPHCPRPLREIVIKALASDPARRYRSAADFKADLQAFLEHQPTRAERERSAARGATATLETARAYFRKVTRHVARAGCALQVIHAAGWFALGMALWIGGALGFAAWQNHQARLEAATVPPSAPSPPRAPALAGLFTFEAEQVLAAWRASDDNALVDFDWPKAAVCLERARDLGGSNDRVLSELALSRGYAALAVGADSESTVALFHEAARLQPGAAAPHLALARLFVYAVPNVEIALEEFAVAERLGATLGAREIEQQGDAYRLRAERLRNVRPRQAWADGQQARAFYSRIAGFDLVPEHRRELAAFRSPAPATHSRRGAWR